MHNPTKLALTTLAILMTPISSAVADSEITGNIAISTDYVWRGISQSDEDPAISGGFDFSNSLFYAGVWASNVDFNDGSDTNIEVDLYGGLASEFDNGISWDVGVIRYNYPDSDNQNLDFTEIYAGLGYTLSNGVELGGQASWDPDNKNVYVEGSVGYAFTDNFSADAGIGNYSFDGAGDYTTWSLGGTYSVFGVDLDLRYFDTNISGSRIAGERVVFSVSKAL